MNPLDREGEAYNRKLVEALMRTAIAARKDPRVFFERVMREETKFTRLRALAHQRVFFSFVMHHRLCVVRMPPGFSKTYGTIALAIWLLGSDQTERGAYISSSEKQASKPLAMIRDIIEKRDEIAPELALIFPDLVKSPRPNDPWGSSAITVNRPPGIRDPSIAAYGVESESIIGSRLSWIVVDDVLNLENTLTKEARDKTNNWFLSVVRSRLDPNEGRCIVTNTPWDPNDLTYFLEKQEKWPTLTMDAFGNVVITNADPEWDSEDIRPSTKLHAEDRHVGDAYRLTEHDCLNYGAPLARRELAHEWKWKRADADFHKPSEPQYFDVDESIPLWPERFSLATLKEIAGNPLTSGASFARNYKMIAEAVAGRKCHPQWVAACKEIGRRLGYDRMIDRYIAPAGMSVTTTGVDIGGLGLGKDNDNSAIFTVETFIRTAQLANGFMIRAGMKRLLRVRYGKWRSSELVANILKDAAAFGSTVRVERNAEQSISQWLEEANAELPLTPHHTGIDKHHVVFGVTSVFTAMEKGLWIIPNDADGRCEPDVEQWIDDCLSYRPPPAHTGDALMASWLALEEARSHWTPGEDAGAAAADSVQALLMSR